MDPSPSQGRRGNGLQSPDWGALVDLDPRLSDALLSSLAAAGVAAYVEPALGSNTFTRAATLPDRPLDRLWVDPSQADTARLVVGAEVADLTTLLAEQEPGATAHGLVQPVPRTAARRVLTPPPLPGPPRRSEPRPAQPRPADSRPAEPRPAEPRPADSRPAESRPAEPGEPQPGEPQRPDPVADAPSRDAVPQAEPEPASDDPDEAFRRIVEGFSRDADTPVPPWPVAEDVEPPSRRLLPPRTGRSEDEPPRRRRTDRDEDEALPGWVEPEPIEDEGHYVPPPPPPVPRLAPQKLAAAAALLAGVILMFAPGLLLQDRTAFVGMVGVLLTVGGAAAIVYLMRDAPPTDSGPDDGAVV